MDIQIVHEQRNRIFSYFLAELFEVVAEVFAGARLIMDLDQPYTLFLRHGCDHWAIADVDLFLVTVRLEFLEAHSRSLSDLFVKLISSM